MSRTPRALLVAVSLGCTVVLSPVHAAEPPAPGAPPARETLKSGSFEMQLPLGLQAGATYIPDNNALTAEKIALGKLLYFDHRLSKDKSISCASCHNPYHGFADPSPTSKGVGLKPKRKTPLFNGNLECRLYTFPMVAGNARDL